MKSFVASFKFNSPKGFALKTEKEFNSQAHLTNYINVMARNGYSLDEVWRMEVVVLYGDDVSRNADGEVNIYRNHSDLNNAVKHLKNLGHTPRPVDLSVYKTMKKQ